MSHPWRAAACLFALFAACTSGPRAEGPIVLVVVDTLRADHTSCYGYERPTTPALCAFADEAVLFERAYTVRPTTTPAVASILTGLYPYRHGLRSLFQMLPEGRETLAALLAARGWATAGFASSFVMIDAFSGLGEGFALYDDFVETRELNRENYERAADATVDRVLRWLDDAPAKSFLFVHLIDPHGPYTPPAPYDARFALPPGGERPGHVPPYQRRDGFEYVAEYVGQYDGEIAGADAAFGRLLDGLRAHERYDAATIIFTADHGESLGEEGRWFRHSASVHDAEVRVPLVVKFGDVGAPRGVRVAEPVSVVDVFPTVLAAAGLHDRAAASQGVDLRTLAAGAPRDAPPPLAEARLGRSPSEFRLAIALAGSTCSGRWLVSSRLLRGSWEHGGSWVLRDPSLAETWWAIARFTDPPLTECHERLARAATPLVADLLTHRLDVPIVRRVVEARRSGARTRFVEGRRDRQVPLDEDEAAALRSLGYLE